MHIDINPFNIQSIAQEDGAVLAVLGINTGSDILKGHFPGHPVVPGACMLQTIKEVLASALKHEVRLRKADSLKFMRMIDPENTETVLLDIAYALTDDDTVNVAAKLSTAEVICFKFQGSFIKA